MVARSFHTHELGRLTVGCPECIRETRAAEDAARWDEAPLRRVTWKCTYNVPVEDPAGPPESLSFTLDVKVPADATPDEVNEHWAGLTGEAFVLALPDTVDMDHTTYAAETMDVESVTIGPVLDQPAPVLLDQPSLFGEAS